MKTKCLFIDGLIGIGLGLVVVGNALAGTVSVSDLNAKQMSLTKQLLQTEIKADLAANLDARIIEAVSRSENHDPTLGGLLMGEPMSPETQEVMTSGVYGVLAHALASYGVTISKESFQAKLGKILEYSTRLGVFPSALTVGYMGRYQAGIGGSAGSQFNFYFNKGKFTLSEYSIFGIHAGYAEMTKLQFYVSLCFGTCFGGDATGWYVGFDKSASAGVGAGLFVEGGVDITDLLYNTFTGQEYSVKDLYQSKAIYIGVGVDVGQGLGISGDVFYYTHDFDKILSKGAPNASTFHGVHLD